MVNSTPEDLDPADEPAAVPAPAGRAGEAPHGAGAAIPVVGIGASAGGLAAFEAFFSAMPAETSRGMAFVLVQHLAPDHKSLLADLVRRYTCMQVREVEDGMAVQPGCAYIIPPGRDMAFLNGALHLLESQAPRGQRMTIDYFFRSLAQDQRERAIGIVLSGTGSDGTMGLRAIKGEGGMVMAQKPESTEFDGMPRSAIATGLVDYELSPGEMPAQLLAYVERAFGKPWRPARPPEPSAESALKRIFVILRAETGHDFSQYKPSTLQRRIERRLAVNQIDTAEAYVRYLQHSPAEVDALFRDLLIGVTQFFRDPEVFEALGELVLPRLLAGKPDTTALRVWSVGCSTGEEAYSVAILLQEHMEAFRRKNPLQVFATDIDSRAIATARAGQYPASIAVDVSAPRLARCFTAEADASAYRIRKSIRDLLVFSEQDVIKDPPFSKLDLLCCRNVMIYMGAELQKKLIPLFHYALKPGGFLLLGTSESVGDFGDLFTIVDRKAKLFRRREDVHGAHRLALGRFALGSFLPPAAAGLPVSPPAGKNPTAVKTSLRQITEQALLQHFGPAAALVNGQGNILYIHCRTGLYLEPVPGEAAINNILAMAREGLRTDLAVALRRAVTSGEVVSAPNLRVRTNGHQTTVNLTVRPVGAGAADPPDAPLFLVVLMEAPPGVPAAPSAPDAEAGAQTNVDAVIAGLKQEIRAKEEYLQTTHEELETSNEELKSSNEEMQSINEELQSTNEELETSKEELQSINEELATVNSELQTKVLDLSRTNNDMNNLLAGTGIATVFVDHGLRILRFTPAATRIINLIASDVGRPVGHIVSNLIGYDALIKDVQSVLDTLVPWSVDVQTLERRWYSLNIQPYRTLDNVIEGAVITFVDITELKLAMQALTETQALARLAAAARDAVDAVVVQGLDGRILGWNPAAERLYGWREAEALAMHMHQLLPPPLRAAARAALVQVGEGESLEPMLTQRLTKAGTVVTVRVTATALVDDSGRRYAVTSLERLQPVPPAAPPEAPA